MVRWRLRGISPIQSVQGPSGEYTPSLGIHSESISKTFLFLTLRLYCTNHGRNIDFIVQDFSLLATALPSDRLKEMEVSVQPLSDRITQTKRLFKNVISIWNRRIDVDVSCCGV